ncbi:MAG: A/G-specific adenine glycosylase [Candidatus Latescibacterota bacterium]
MDEYLTIAFKSRTLQAIRQRLLLWFDQTRRQLPWRGTKDPYRTWVSEVMLQQTRVTTVIPYYKRFLDIFPDVQSLAEANIDAVLKIWEGLGYYARARNLHRAANLLVTERNGIIPDDYGALRDVPGVGDYIAAAVLSQSFNKPHAVVDGNVKRVLARLLSIDAPVNHSSSMKIYKAHASRLLDTKRPGDFNQAVMELGALICRPANPDCGHCPIRNFCRAHETGMQSTLPVRSPKRPVPHRRVAVGVVRRGGKILITQRKPSGLLGGLWEFPGGKIQQGEPPEDACKREIEEKLNLRVDVERHVARVRHAYSHFTISMDVYDCRYKAGKVKLNGPANYKWIAFEEIEQYAFPGANRKFIPLLRK